VTVQHAPGILVGWRQHMEISSAILSPVEEYHVPLLAELLVVVTEGHRFGRRRGVLYGEY